MGWASHVLRRSTVFAETPEIHLLNCLVTEHVGFLNKHTWLTVMP